MSPENFCYWLQGYLELTGKGAVLSPEQVKMIADHLGYVFNKNPAPQPMPITTTPLYPDIDKFLRDQELRRREYEKQVGGLGQQTQTIGPWTPPLTVTC